MGPIHRLRTPTRAASLAGPLAVVLNRDGIILYANPELAELLAVHPPHLEGRAFEELVLPRQRPRYRGLVEGAGPGDGRNRLILCRPDGQPMPIQACLRRLEPPGTEVIILVALDAARHYRHTHRLRREKAELERRVRDRTAELLHANQMLQDDVRRREAAEAALRTRRRSGGSCSRSPRQSSS